MDDFQRRHRGLGLPIAVVYKFFDDQGGYLTALMTYYGFVSLFPLLLVATTVLGYVLHGHPDLQQQILGSALTKFPIVGAKLQDDVQGYSGSGTGLVVGVVTSLYGSLGVAQATQNAFNQMYAVPRNERPNPLLARLRSLALMLFISAGALATYGLTWLSSRLDGWEAQIASPVASVAIYFGVFVVGFRVLTARDLSLADVWVGAASAAVAWELLQLGGKAYVTAHLHDANDVYGTFGLVLGLLAWIYLQAAVVVMAVELNVVLRRSLWPRSLLTPFTDDVNLTSADERSYTSYAQAQRHKGFERVDVEFEPREPGADDGTG